MKIIKSICIAFSMYSKIPVPQFEWKEEDMKYALCFFPFVGGVIAAIFFIFRRLADFYSFGTISITFLTAAIPVLITGGIHIDGYMDTMDALHSYQEKEKKLEILKDPHIGAFSVIMLLLYYLCYLSVLSEIRTAEEVKMIAAGFVLSRVAGAAAVISLKPAKKNGLLRIFADAASKRNVKTALLLEGGICMVYMLYLSTFTAVVIFCTAALWFLFYRARCYKEFGGVSGDTTGYFITILEFLIAAVTVIMI